MSEIQKSDTDFSKKTDGQLVLNMKSKEFASMLDRNKITIAYFYSFCKENHLIGNIRRTSLEKMRSAPNNSYKIGSEIPPIAVNALMELLGRDLFVAMREDYAKKQPLLLKIYLVMRTNQSFFFVKNRCYFYFQVIDNLTLLQYLIQFRIETILFSSSFLFKNDNLDKTLQLTTIICY